ncbi:molecular chaperone HtpG [Merdimmobilis hominis]|jgi:molecular chaperone HtpG|uniref:molecular chaperone HtpG n=1 Tax=Merdimmobilis hominis TaxID=2897707 RepID=UPI0008F844B0|nr:molecular chaperone HtpG [Merdimmobilis hominis]PWL58347.1 MAG: molecular chaperone HtpG [Oscillospiraceae bacterium]
METKEFKAESKRLLDLMINSIYTHKEIFLRELISNASDAIDKLYYHSLSGEVSGLSRDDFSINIALDKENRTITITDNGCGMTKDELEANLGTIAKSGSLDFKQTQEKNDDIDIIGQFGVGFYSAFMVSDCVTVTSRAFGSDEAWQWQSHGAEGYTLEPAQMEGHGTRIVLSLKESSEEENYDEFLQDYRITGLVKQYSDYIRYPIRMAVERSRIKEGTGTEDKPAEYETYTEVETLNSMVPIWRKQKSEVTDEDYNNFYKEKFFDYEDPLKVIRTSTEGAATYDALLFIPSRAPLNYYSKDYEKGLQLYASGVLIMQRCADLLPDCFSFVRGLVDSQDLSLNISREMLQHDRQLKVIAGRLEKKIKSELLSMLKNDRETYDKFFKAFGLQLKYGLYSGYGQNKELLQDLVLFYSSSEKKLVSLEEYVSRMKGDQKYIYYVCGESVSRIDHLPQIELLKDKGYEVLYLTDEIDEFALKMLYTYADKEFRSASDSDLGLETEEEKEEAKKQTEENKPLLDFLKDSLEGKVSAVRLSQKLKSHPVCLSSDGPLSIEMEKVLNSLPAAEEKVKAERVLEINAGHPVFGKLQALYADPSKQDRVKAYAGLLYNQALLIEGLPIEDPVAFSNSICELMQE